MWLSLLDHITSVAVSRRWWDVLDMMSVVVRVSVGMCSVLMAVITIVTQPSDNKETVREYGVSDY